MLGFQWMDIVPFPSHRYYTATYESRPYWDTTTGAVNYSYSMSVPCLSGYNGPKICIYRPNPIIKI